MVSLSHLRLEQVLRKALFISLNFPEALSNQKLVTKLPSLIIEVKNSVDVGMMVVILFHSLPLCVSVPPY